MADAPRRGLGRGLSALLGDAEPYPGARPPSPATGAPQAGAEIPIELLRRNPDQPRRRFDETELDELADSIRARGLIQPLLVRPAPGAPGEWQIVAGERRWRAAQKAGLHAVPVVVRELSDAEVLEIGIVENVQRADLDAVEEAQGYQALIERFGHTQAEVAQTVGKSRSHVANALRLLALPAPVQAHLTAGRLTAGHARAIMTAPDPAKLAEQVVARSLSVRQAEALGRRASERPEPPAVRRPGASPRPPPRGKDPDIAAIESDTSAALGLKVEIEDEPGAGGEVRIAYRTLDQLDEVLRRLAGV